MVAPLRRLFLILRRNLCRINERFFSSKKGAHALYGEPLQHFLDMMAGSSLLLLLTSFEYPLIGTISSCHGSLS